MDRPQLIEYSHQSLAYTVYDCRWIQCSAKFVTVGMRPNGKGVIELYELDNDKIARRKEIEKRSAFKCCTFGAASLRNRHLAVGDFEGRLQVIDLENPDIPVFNEPAHSAIINCIDGFGGKSVDCGAPEIVTGSRDGAVRVWDIRQQGPVVNMTCDKPEQKVRDCWAVAIGNSYNNADRIVAAGFDNGDVKLFDLRMMRLRHQWTLGNGVCGLEFDRRDIPMNKLAVTTLEGGLYVYDTKTLHSKRGYACVREEDAGRSVGTNGVITGPKATVWQVRHLPQNRDVFVTCGGTGSVRLWQYKYPGHRAEEIDGEQAGIAGEVEMIGASALSTQPVHSWDWHPDRLGLGLAAAFDQTVRVIITTKLNLYQ